jgi:(p)ppGpp synthase/HD superfamily hydrolase
MVPSDRFLEALNFAVRLHRDQRRKLSGAPYAAHLLAVTAIALEHGAGEDEAIAALLHDAIEDRGGTAARKEIRRRFGDNVTAIVDGCTDADTKPKPPWRERKEAYVRKLAEAPASVRLVGAADKLDNARSLLREYRAGGEDIWKHFRGGREGTLWYFRAVVDALRRAGDSLLLDELDRTVSELEGLVGREAPPQ